MSRFVITASFVKVTAALGDAEVGRLFRAMCEYALNGTEPELRGNERVLFPAAKMMIDENRIENSNEINEITRENEKERTKEKEKERACDTHNNKYSPDFEKFWSEYPRKIDKQKAYNSWKKIDFESVTLCEILESLKAWAACEQWENERFIPHPTVWLNNRRWEAKPAKSKQKNPALRYEQTQISETDWNNMTVDLD